MIYSVVEERNKMGKPRVRGNHARIMVITSSGSEIDVGEVSKFSVKELGEVKKSRAIGQNSVTANKTFEGYDLSFEGGKVDWNLAQLLHKQDELIYTGRRAPSFRVIQKVFFFDGSVEQYTFEDVTIYGYNLDVDANDELMEKFEGFCGQLKTPLMTGQAATDKDANDASVDALLSRALTGVNNSIIGDSTMAKRVE